MSKIFSYKCKRKKKRGQIGDIIFFMVTVFALLMALLIGKYVLSKVNSGLEESGLHTDASRDALTKFEGSFNIFDNGIVVVLIFLTIGLVISSFMIPVHPIYLVINIFGIFILAFLGMIMSNMYYDIIQGSEELQSVYGNFEKLNFVMNKLPWIACILIFITTIIMFSKSRQENG